MTMIYHYTIGSKLTPIMEDGFIRTSPLKPDNGETPVVWLSSNENFEQSARKMAFIPSTQQQRLLTVFEMLKMAGGLVRYVFDKEQINAISWAEAQLSIGMSKNKRGLLLKRSRMVGSKPKEWWVVPKSVSLSQAMRVEVCDEVDSNGKFIWKDIEAKNIQRNQQHIVSMTVDQLQKTVSLDMNKAWRNAN
ncbi:hypothetical protein ACEI25_001523 [Photobacterium damselae]|uniref:hypothetical protein n=1 Tax=Photobacterium damselae TaxID=38293 RepID=UPI0015A276F6|nr:hypothetical protein [Photobacterium damselae]NVO61485.1 hypothetical protein [Photobacterium damselae subsp. damselae]